MLILNHSDKIIRHFRPVVKNRLTRIEISLSTICLFCLVLYAILLWSLSLLYFSCIRADLDLLRFAQIETFESKNYHLSRINKNWSKTKTESKRWRHSVKQSLSSVCPASQLLNFDQSKCASISRKQNILSSASRGVNNVRLGAHWCDFQNQVAPWKNFVRPVPCSLKCTSKESHQVSQLVFMGQKDPEFLLSLLSYSRWPTSVTTNGIIS